MAERSNGIAPNFLYWNSKYGTVKANAKIGNTKKAVPITLK